MMISLYFTRTMFIKNIFYEMAIFFLIFMLSIHRIESMEEKEKVDNNQLDVVANFNHDILTIIFQDLSIEQVLQCSKVSILWNNIASKEQIWEAKARIYSENGGVFNYKYYLTDHISETWKEIIKNSYPYKNEIKQGADHYQTAHFNSFFYNSFEDLKQKKINKNKKNNIIDYLLNS